jgi:hypothetical protein
MDTITLSDDSCGPVTYVSGDSNNDAQLQTNEVWVYRCTVTLTKDTSNVATVTGTANGLTATDLAYATVLVGTPLPPPLIHLVKKPSPLLLPMNGGTVQYTYTVTNPGTVALSSVHVIDDRCAPVVFAFGDSNNDALLTPDETWTYTCAATLHETTTNTATATGKANGMIATDVALATVAVALHPVIPPVDVPPVIAPPEIALPPAPTQTIPAPTPEVPLLPNTGMGPSTSPVFPVFLLSSLILLCSLIVSFRSEMKSGGTKP